MTEFVWYQLRSTDHRYEFWVHCMFLVLVPWFSLLCLNGGIIWSMKRKKASKHITKMWDKVSYFQKMCCLANHSSFNQERARQQDQITKMLLFVTFAFIVLLGWQCVTQCFWMIGQNDWITSPTVDAHWQIIDQMYAIGKPSQPQLRMDI